MGGRAKDVDGYGLKTSLYKQSRAESSNTNTRDVGTRRTCRVPRATRERAKLCACETPSYGRYEPYLPHASTMATRPPIAPKLIESPIKPTKDELVVLYIVCYFSSVLD